MNTSQKIEEKVFSYIRKYHMLDVQDRVVVGVSGGADSVCLLFLLLEWSRENPLELAVVHVNHGIRKEAAEDARYVEELCRREGLPFFLTEADMRGRALKEKCSEEEAGRRIRYEAFERVAGEWGAGHIAVAHNGNDRSETQLFHLFRGSGIRGLASIQPVRGKIIRPLLCLERREIEAYLQEKEIPYCRDATNESDDYTRNRIRHHILPYAEEHISQGLVAHMNQTAELLSETEDYLEKQTLTALEECVCGRKPWRIRVDRFLEQHPVIQKRLLHEVLKALSPAQRDIGYVHVQELFSLFAQEGNRTFCLPFGIRGRREYDVVVLYTEQEQSGEEPYWKPEFKVFSLENLSDIFQKSKEVPQNEYTKWFDYDKINGYPVMRTRQTGDYLTLADGQGGCIHKTLKDYMIDCKIPRGQRDQLLLLADGHHVLWLVGYRISEYFKITENTKRILQVQLLREERL